jgi:TolA-binding protein
MVVRVLLLSTLLLSGCLRTREDIKEVEAAAAMREQVSSLQKVHADSNSRMEELQEQNRNLNGRIEELEHRLVKSEQDQGSGKENLQKSLEDSKRTNDLLQESIVKLQNELQALQEEMVALKVQESTKAGKAADAKGKDKEKSKDKDHEKDKSLMEAGLGNFQDKKWKEAILNFDQYREKNPKGKYAAEATYRTGVCFQELGMVDEAKVFFQEVVAKFPQSEMAKKAQYRLKSIK